MDKRYQVFVSSTYVDLIPERSEVMQALLELECMPAGMELFPAANDSQWNWIKKVIDESDYYIVIVAGRYGTVSKETGLSYTEMEYRYAVEIGKPIIGFLHEDVSKLQAKASEQTTVGKKKLVSFRDLVGGRLCKMYSSSADLGAKVSRSITQLKKQHPAVGWVRASILDSIASSDELLRLKEENELLKEKIYRMGVQAPENTESLASGNESFEIRFGCTRSVLNPQTGRYRKASTEYGSIRMTWDEMFSKIGPDLIKNNGRYWSLSSPLISKIESRALPELRRKHPNDQFDHFHMTSDCQNTIMIQLRALKLIATTEDEHGSTVWELTPYGDNYLTKLVAVPKEIQKS